MAGNLDNTGGMAPEDIHKGRDKGGTTLVSRAKAGPLRWVLAKGRISLVDKLESNGVPMQEQA